MKLSFFQCLFKDVYEDKRVKRRLKRRFLKDIRVKRRVKRQKAPLHAYVFIRPEIGLDIRVKRQ
jgi:hypothetical protein